METDAPSCIRRAVIMAWMLSEETAYVRRPPVYSSASLIQLRIKCVMTDVVQL
jgi:hypothetical protein